MSDINQKIAQYSGDRRKLPDRTLDPNVKESDRPAKISRRDKIESAPLSFAQEQIWTHYNSSKRGLDRLEPGNRADNRSLNIRITGKLNLDALEKAINKIVHRHEILRTSFTTIDGQTLQTIAPSLMIHIPLIDLSDLPSEEQQIAIDANVVEAAQQTFDLSQLPLFRSQLLRLSNVKHILLLTMHQTIVDDRSVAVLLDELGWHYQELVVGTSSPLPALPIQYGDFAIWQRDQVQGEKLQCELDYWKQQLGGHLPILELPANRSPLTPLKKGGTRSRSPIGTFRGARLEKQLPKHLSDSLNDLSVKEDVTLFMTLLAAFKILLYRYTGEEDILVGTPVTDRDRAETENLIGVFINTLVLRSRFQGNPTVREFLHQVRRVALEAFSHQQIPFQAIVAELQPESDPTQATLFQVLFQLRNLTHSHPLPGGDLEKLTVADLTLEEFKCDLVPPFLRGVRGDREMATCDLNSDLNLDIVETSTGLVCSFEYNRDLFDRSTIEQIAEHFQLLLEGIVANPEQRVAQLPLLTKRERHQLFVEWNNTVTEYPRDRCIHQLFERQVEKTPDAVAVVFESEQLTYGQLNQKANQLAHYLRDLGVGSDVLVGICVERSIETIVGLLGILKAGGAYVPLDPNYPQERLAYMLEDAAVSVLLTQNRLRQQLPNTQAKILCLDTQWSAIASTSQQKPINQTKPDNLAYINYTSGSTGKPKGVAIVHRGVIRLLFGINYVSLTASDKLLQAAPISFDAATFEIWGALLHGGQCILFPENIPTAKNLSHAIQTYGITTVWLTAALFNSIIDDRPSTFTGVRQLLTGGEALSVKHIQKALDALPSVQIINGYGPTESTTFTCCYPIPKPLKKSISSISSIPIGRAIGNTQVYILDKHLQPVPIGIAGELHIGGDGLARGYLNRPELTQEKFIANPFNKEPGSRLYKTGDKARYLPDGNIEFIGRIDHQVKIRGFRIELGEIETKLSEYPQVKDVVVIAREDIPGDKRLVAYIVAEKNLTDPSSSPTGKECTHPSSSPPRRGWGWVQLREFLKQKLPDYMVPNAFVFLERLPLTPNGKIDRRALPAPDITSIAETNFVPPRTSLQKQLAAIWSQILRVETIGIHDNFFELGGHSLKATQVISGIRKSLGVELPLRTLFEATTIAELAQVLEATDQSLHPVEIEPIKPREAHATLSLSFTQERLWFLDRLEGKSATYNIPSAWQLNGELSIAALHEAIDEIIRRHEILRTTFTTSNGVPIQVIAENLNLNIEIIDLPELPDNETIPSWEGIGVGSDWEGYSESSQQVQRWISEEAQHPFNLAKDSLVRVKLLRLSSHSHILMITIHHIIFDGWSMGVFWQELSTLYKAFSQGQPSPLPQLPIQYADYALWQKKWFSFHILEPQLNYWQKQLSGTPPLLELPYDRPRPSVQTFRGGSESFKLSKNLTKQLHKLSQQSRCTLFMTLLAAWSSLLYRYSGQSDILVGTPLANRNREEIAGLIGFFVNTLVMRTKFKEHERFADVLKKVRQTALDAYAHQDLPFELLVEELKPERSLSYNPVFQVMFALQNADMGNLEFPGISANKIEPKTTVSKFDLTLSMEETQSGLIGVWEYNSDLFDRYYIRRWIEHFKLLLEGIVANPQQPVERLPWLTERERYQLVVEWNDTVTEYPHDQCIHQLFEEQVEKTPDAIAVVFEETELTYRQLNKRANQLAHYLRDLGVGPDVLVGICVERSLEMLIGLLGILKAGGAYVPLDPTYPPQRIEYILSNSQAKLLITSSHLLNDLPSLNNPVICLDRDVSDISEQRDENPHSQVTAKNLSYVIYTSGSTGQPKGVQICHRSLVNFIHSMKHEPGLSSGDRILAITTICFDIHTLEIYLPLTVGATIVLASQEEAIDGLQLAEKIARDGVNVMQATPASWQMLLNANWSGNSELKGICGGEALSQSLADRLLEKVGSLWNIYGPTETTVWSTTREVKPDYNRHEDAPESIGRPISNTQIYILDKYLQPVPIGIPGELHIGGDGLARGYLNRPELTEEKFIANPFSDRPGSRLYKTGDKARYLPDGNIEYLGRIDHQVKIRGFRIELGEIEAKLSEHPHVKDAVVISREDIPGDKRLVAYIVCDRSVPSLSEFRSFLKQRLPDYMVPSGFVSLEKLPLTPNGKIDRRALPAPDITSIAQTTFVSPRNATEEKIAAIWSQVLGVTKIGIHDNFFELGGHSLKATQAIAGIRERFSLELPLRTLFEAPTIAQFARAIETTGQCTHPYPPRRGTLQLIETEEIKPRKADAILSLSFAQERLWFLSQLEESSDTYHMACAWQLNGELSIAALEAAMNEIIRRHEVLRTTFTTSNGVPTQVIAQTLNLKLEIIDLLELPENKTFPSQEGLGVGSDSEGLGVGSSWERLGVGSDSEDYSESIDRVQRWVSEEAQRPFNLAKDCLVRVKLLRLSSQFHILTITIHHIIFDGWSMGVFWQELSTLYKAFSQGEHSPLAELPIQYADYALWQKKWLEKNRLDAHLQYWKQQLKDAQPLLELPYDHPRPSVQTFTGQTESLVLSQRLSQAIKTLSQQEGVTLFMTLLAVFKLLLSRLSGLQDIAIGTPVAGRDRPEIEQLIGFFINTVVLRTELKGNITFRELLGRVRDVTLDAYEHQDMPFEKLVEELRPERDRRYHPIFQVWFNLLNFEETELELSGLNVEPMSREDAPAKFDLNMYVRERQQTIHLEAVYNADLFDAASIEHLLHQYEYLLEQVITNPQDSIQTFSLVTHQAAQRLPSPIQPLQNDCNELVHVRFSQQAKAQCDRIAVVDRHRSWTYAELDKRSNQLANYLLANKLRREDIVAVYANRNSNLVWALLGILKAGCAFMILDPAYPAARLIDCLQMAQPIAWIDLTDTPLDRELQNAIAGLSLHCLLRMTDELNLDNMSSDRPQVVVNPDDLAYVAFTSGSTGKPKGIKGSHKPLSHFIQWHSQTFGLNELDRFSLLSGLAHDPLLRDIFTPLWVGATLYIPETEDIHSDLADWMQQKSISVTHLTPAMTQLLGESSAKLPSLRYVFFGGDRLTRSDVDRIEQLATNATCVNFYGTTETPQAMGYFVVKDDSTDRHEEIPLGQGIDDVQLLILNEGDRLAGIGELGEIYVRTAYLTQEYLADPTLTQKRFPINPFTNIEGDRLYKTGDRARYLPDGTVKFVGRIDHQVKIRGFRIELGEIETKLSEYPQVKEVVAIAREDIPGDQRLVAYIVAEENATHPSSSPPGRGWGWIELRSFLKQQLPNYMVPSAFVFLEKLPLTPNGKIDRRALPAPDRSDNSIALGETNVVAPRDELELRLTQIWQQVLGIQSIGVKDNFFDLGGHSLIAVRLFAEIEKVFGKNLPLATLFQAPTIEHLAHVCRDRGWKSPWRSLVTIQPEGTKPPLFFVHGIYGNVLYFRELANYLGSDRPFYGLQAKGLDGKQTPYTTLEEMADHYVKEMRECQPNGPYFIGGHSFGCLVAFEIAQQLHAQGQEVGLLALLDQGVSRSVNVPFWSWISGHVNNLLALGFSDRVDYIMGRLSAKLQQMIPKPLRLLYQQLANKETASEHQRFLTVMEANIQAINRYEVTVYPGKVTLFRAKIGSPKRYGLDPMGGWGDFALGGVDAIDVPGDHMSLIKEPHLPVLAKELKACLDRVQETMDPPLPQPTPIPSLEGNFEGNRSKISDR